MAAGKTARENARCPNCRSLERQRFVYLFLEKQTSLFDTPHHLLHIAPERCLFQRLATAENVLYTPADKFTAGNRYPAQTVNMDVTDIKYGDNTFDAILCSHVLEHVPDDRRALSELHRVLKPRGWAVILVPIRKGVEHTYEDPTFNTPKARERAFGQFDHVRYYGRDFEDRLRESGFSIQQYTVQDLFTPSLIEKYRIGRSDDIYFCRRRL